MTQTAPEAPADARRTRVSLIFILITVTGDSMGLGLMIPILPDLIREIDQGSLARAALWGGAMSLIYAAMQFLFSPLLGALSDRYGRRPILLGSLVVMSGAYLIMALATSIFALLVGRFIAGAAAATQGTASAYVADISRPEEKAARFGLIGAAFGIGFVLGPVLGGLLAEFGTRAPLYAAGALALLNAIFGALILPETVTDRIRRRFEWRRANPLGALAQMRKLPGIMGLLAIFFLYNVAFGVYPAVWSFFTTARFGWEPSMIGLSLAGFGIALAIVQGGLIRLILSRLGDAGTVIYGIVFNVFAFLALAIVTSGSVALILTPLTALGAVVTPALQGMMSRRVSDDAQGELQGVLTSTSALAMMISPMIMTGVFSAFTREAAPVFFPGAPFLVSMGLMILSGVVFLGRKRRAA